jgi:hypothetical protein
MASTVDTGPFPAETLNSLMLGSLDSAWDEADKIHVGKGNINLEQGVVKIEGLGVNPNKAMPEAD